MKRNKDRSLKNGKQDSKRLPAAGVIWRVMQPGDGFDIRDTVHNETPVEQEALTSFRALRASGCPVIVVRSQIYRVQIKPRVARDAERFAFVEAYSRADACARVAMASAGVERFAVSDARTHVLAAKSYEDCLRDGISADPELRLFELAWSDGKVT